jgi:hypothetical protein
MFQQRRDACGLVGASIAQKMTAAFRALAYGNSADIIEENGRLGDSKTCNFEDVPRNCQLVRGQMVACGFLERTSCSSSPENTQYSIVKITNPT